MDKVAYAQQALTLAGYSVVSIIAPVLSDQTTWLAELADGATPEQRQAANTELRTMVIDEDALEEGDVNARINGDPFVRALVLWCAQKFEVTENTARTEITDIYKALQ